MEMKKGMLSHRKKNVRHMVLIGLMEGIVVFRFFVSFATISKNHCRALYREAKEPESKHGSLEGVAWSTAQTPIPNTSRLNTVVVRLPRALDEDDPTWQQERPRAWR